MKYFLLIFALYALGCGKCVAADKIVPGTNNLPLGGNSLQTENSNLTTEEYKAAAELQAELINSELNEIAAQIKQLNPDLYNQMQSESAMKQLYAYRSWLARQAFDWYKTRLIADLKLKSKNTGRNIKKIGEQNKDYIFSNEQEFDDYIAGNCGDDNACQFWLDRGKYDSPECYTKDGYRDFGICEYALDFEEYTLSLSPNNIFVIKGDATDNTFTFYDIVLSQTEQEYFLDVTATVGDLSEWITHDNQSIKFYKALNELQGREKRQFIKQYSQSYMNGEIDNTVPGSDVWGVSVNSMGVFNK